MHQLYIEYQIVLDTPLLKQLVPANISTSSEVRRTAKGWKVEVSQDIARASKTTEKA